MVRFLWSGNQILSIKWLKKLYMKVNQTYGGSWNTLAEVYLRCKIILAAIQPKWIHPTLECMRCVFLSNSWNHSEDLSGARSLVHICCLGIYWHLTAEFKVAAAHFFSRFWLGSLSLALSAMLSVSPPLLTTPVSQRCNRRPESMAALHPPIIGQWTVYSNIFCHILRQNRKWQNIKSPSETSLLSSRRSERMSGEEGWPEDGRGRGNEALFCTTE